MCHAVLLVAAMAVVGGGGTATAMVEEAATAAAEEMDNEQRPKWRNFERESCKIVLKIAFPIKNFPTCSSRRSQNCAKLY